jgi:RNA polymerase sigma-70 factor (ECF subfamily)
LTAALALLPPNGGQWAGIAVAFAEPHPLRLVRAARPRGRQSERALIDAARGGSETALEELFRRHWPKAWRSAFLIVHDAPAAEDIAQEAFLAAIRSLGQFDRRRPFGPWLHRIVVNRAIDVTRARALRREVGVEADEVTASANPATGTAPYPDDVVAALRSLPAEHRAVVVMRYLLEYTPGEIAAALEIPRGTVNSRLRRGLDRLGEQLGEVGP